jgi:DNA topoisomerase IA
MHFCAPVWLTPGRVQSVALRLVSEREEAVQLFVPDEYWTIEADFSLSSSSSSSSGGAAATLPAKLVEVDGQKLSQLSIKSQQQAQELVQRLWQQQQQQQVWYTVRSVVKRPVRRNPPPPLVTSTLQQEAARRLGFGASKTMQVAQQLYEGANTGRWALHLLPGEGVICGNVCSQLKSGIAYQERKRQPETPPAAEAATKYVPSKHQVQAGLARESPATSGRGRVWLRLW